MLARWSNFGSEFRPLGDLWRQMDRLFADFERDWDGEDRRPWRIGPAASDSWPRITIDDTGKEFLVRAEVPGMSEKELSITIDQDSLTLRGERKVEAPRDYSVHRQERGTLSFARSWTLPCRVDSEKVVAQLKNGVLELTLPRAAEEQPRQIHVRAS